MRTAAICPTCATYTNSICVLYDGPYLPCTGISPLDSIAEALAKIDAAICALGGTTTTSTTTTAGPTTTTTTSSTSSTTTTTTTTTISPLCDDFILDYGYSFADADNTLNIIFNGYTTIPVGFSQCAEGTSVVINDGLGHTYEPFPPNIPNLVDTSTPLTITNLSDYFNTYTDGYNVTVTSCITNGEVSCTKVTSTTIPNPKPRCPEFTVTPNGTAIDFSFTPSPGLGATYYVRLRNGDTNVIISTQTFTNPSLPVSSSFTSLTIGANYKVELQIFTTLFGLETCTTVNIRPL